MKHSLDNLDEIRDVASTLLRKADIDEQLPTPVSDLVSAVGLIEDADYILTDTAISRAPKELRRLLRSAGRKIRGVLDRRERVLHVSPDVEVPAQRQFVRCHEAMHDALPWQRDLLVFGDTKETLSPEIELRFEQEANQGAAELLFQLDLLARIARDYPTDKSTPIILADMFGASIHATARRWVEHHPRAICCIALDPKPIVNGQLTFRRYEVIESKQWRSYFGSNRFPIQLDIQMYPFLASLSTPGLNDVEEEWVLTDNVGSTKAVRVQSFTNRYRIFLLIWVPKKDGLIARFRRPTRIRVS